MKRNLTQADFLAKMKKFSDLSIKWKLQIIILVVFLSVLIFSITVVSIRTISGYKADLQRQATITAQLVADYFHGDLLQQRPGRAIKKLKRLTDIPEFAAAGIYTTEKTLFAKYSADSLAIIPDSISNFSEKLYQGTYLHLIRPIVLKGGHYGAVYLIYSTAALNQRILDHLVTMLAVFMLLMMVAFIISFTLQKYISQPILRLAETTREIAGLEDYSVKVKKTGNDEIGRLYDSFNVMLDQIHQREQQRNRVLQALKQSETRFRQIIEKSNDAMYVIVRKKFVLVNPKMIEIFGYSKEEFTSPQFNPIDLIADESMELVLERQRAFANGEFVPSQYQFKGKSRSGSIIELEANLSEISWDGQPAVLGMLRDVTRQKHLEEQLHQSQKMEAIGTLAGGVAHDFNNLLTVISGHTELSLLKLSKEEPVYRHITEIEKAGKRAQNLTRQLLAFSRKQIIERKTLNLNDIILDMDKMLKRLIGEDITIELIPDASIPLIKADPGQLEQILMNLVINARDAIRENKNPLAKKQIAIQTGYAHLDEQNDLTLSFKGRRKFVVLSVEDTGSGMDEATKGKIFEPFFTTKGTGKGTGLGLSTIYGIVKQNEGSIHVYSEPGRGSIFRIYWPVAQETVAEPINETLPAQEKPFRGNETLLFVEDDSAVREFAVSALEALGYTIHEAENADHALRLITEDKIQFDLLVTDLIMPGKSGKELADILETRIKNLKVLFASGYTESNIVQDGILQEGINFIHKPYSLYSLTQKIRSLLEENSN